MAGERGIANCDTVKKAMAWLAKNNNTIQFHDYKKEGIDKATLEAWCGMVGWEVLCNKKSVGHVANGKKALVCPHSK